ncbi:MAG: DinB family protein [bacterium]|nr:DinB family protein [bacterium]
MRLTEVFPYWRECRAVLLACLQGLSPADLAWVPPGGRNGIGCLAAHIARVHDRDVTQGVLGRPPLLPRNWDPRTVEELVTPLEALGELLWDYLARSGAEILEKGHGTRPVKDLLGNAWIEELHHRGQIFFLLRLLGREPPAI